MPVDLIHHPAAVTVAITGGAVAVSVAVTQATMWWVGYDADHLPALIAGAIPAAMVPFAVYPLAIANRRLRRMKAELEQAGSTARLQPGQGQKKSRRSANRRLNHRLRGGQISR